MAKSSMRHWRANLKLGDAANERSEEVRCQSLNQSLNRQSITTNYEATAPFHRSRSVEEMSKHVEISHSSYVSIGGNINVITEPERACSTEANSKEKATALQNLENLLNDIHLRIDDDFVSKSTGFILDLKYIANQINTELNFDQQSWEKLGSNSILLKFFECLAHNKSNYRKRDAFVIGCCLKKLFSISEGYLFHHEDKLIQWARESGHCSFESSLTKNDVTTIKQLLQLLKKTLSVLELKEQMSDCLTLEEMNKSETSMTAEMTIAVNKLLGHFQNTGKMYSKCFLQTILVPLGYDCVHDHSFQAMLSMCEISSFYSRAIELSGTYELYESMSECHLQAFLLLIIINSTSDFENASKRKTYFDILVNEIKTEFIEPVLNMFHEATSRIPYMYLKLADGVEKIMNGNIYQDVNRPLQKLKEILSSTEYIICGEEKAKTEMQLLEKNKNLFRSLDLLKYYPSKISIQNVIEIETPMTCVDLKDVPMMLLSKLLICDVNARDYILSEMKDNMYKMSDSDDSDCDSNGIESIPNPLDVLLATICCCNPFLKQTIVHKLFQCQLAIPFLCPPVSSVQRSVLYRWPLRWLRFDAHGREIRVLEDRIKSVAFLKMGRPDCSKSVIINQIVMYNHTCFNKHRPLGLGSEKTIADGLVEMCCFTPNMNMSRKTHLNEPLTLFNLRGDALKHQNHVEVLKKNVSVIVVFADCCDFDKYEHMIKTLNSSNAKVVIMLTNKNRDDKCKTYIKTLSSFPGVLAITNFKRGEELNSDETGKDICRKISKHLEQADMRALPIEKWYIDKEHIDVDEHAEASQMANRYAKMSVKEIQSNDSSNFFPLQSGLWNNYCKLHRQHSEIGTNLDPLEMDNLYVQMEHIRHKQVFHCNELSHIMQTFFMVMASNINHTENMLYFYHWLRLYLDSCTRGQQQTVTTPINVRTESPIMKRHDHVKQECFKFRFENIFREAGQIYESIICVFDEQTLFSNEVIRKMPEIFAKLIIAGQPFEIMDGNTGDIPLAWVSAVFRQIIEILSDKKVFIVSIFGVQSSGKSTLLNVMFGIELPTRTGKCTNGVFMYLLPVHRSRKRVPYDYILIIDTEGLRSPERIEQTYDTDNKMATLVIGMADVTIVNNKGENSSEMQDILQIVVHAFMRIKQVNHQLDLHKRCVFVHQNVQNCNAKDILSHERVILKKNLDKITAEAAKQENIDDIVCFNDVIKFDEHAHSWYLPDLFTGETVLQYYNPRYVSEVTLIRRSITEDICPQPIDLSRLSSVSKYIDDLWNAILTENFVLGFRNSSEKKAYESIERKYKDLVLQLNESLDEWISVNASFGYDEHKLVADDQMKFNETIKRIENFAEQKTKELELELDRYCEMPEHDVLLLRWREKKISLLRSNMRTIVEKSIVEIKEKREQSRLNYGKGSSEMHIERTINAKITSLVDRIKRDRLCTESSTLFEEEWIRIISDFKPKIYSSEADVIKLIKKNLQEEFLSDMFLLTKELEENPLDITQDSSDLGGCISLDSIRKMHSNKSKSGLRSMFRKHTEDHSEDILFKTNRIFRSIDSQIREFERENSKCKEKHICRVMSVLMEHIMKHNENAKTNDLWTFSKGYIVKLTVHMFRCLIPRFKAMNAHYEQQFSAVAIATSYKSTAREYFVKLVNDKMAEEVNVTFLIKDLHEIITRNITVKVHSDIQRDVISHFKNSKRELIVSILESIVDKKDIDSLMKYIDDPKTFVFEWIAEYVHEMYLKQEKSSMSRYAEMANVKSKEIFHHLITCVESITYQELQSDAFSTKEWVMILLKQMRKRALLNLNDKDFQRISKCEIRDVRKFNAMVLNELNELQISVEKDNNRNINYCQNSSRLPEIYRNIACELWGCLEVCPFCHEPCERSDKDHIRDGSKHSCIHHRPLAFRGIALSQKITDLGCNNLVQHKKKKFQFPCTLISNLCKNSGKCLQEESSPVHKFSEYETFICDWDIPPSSKSNSKFWMWVMFQFKKQLNKKYGIRIQDHFTWICITQAKAKESLRCRENY